jgi:hypothetical protein
MAVFLALVGDWLLHSSPARGRCVRTGSKITRATYGAPDDHNPPHQGAAALGRGTASDFWSSDTPRSRRPESVSAELLAD